MSDLESVEDVFHNWGVLVHSLLALLEVGLDARVDEGSERKVAMMFGRAIAVSNVNVEETNLG